MFDTLKKDIRAQLLVLFFLLFSFWWIYLYLFLHKGSDQHQLFSATYGIISLFGALWGMQISRQWGGFRSVMGRAILMFAFGLLAQEFGQLVYSYYTYFLHNDIPYPSIGDIGYFGSIPLYIYGVWLLGKASGTKIGLKSFRRKLGAVILPLLMLSLSYFFFLRDYVFYWSNPLMIFLDFGYPLGQAIYISLALLVYFLSRGVLGGIMKNRIIFIVLALIFQYAADYNFLYQAHNGTSYPGGPVDYMYLLAYFVMILGLLQFSTTAHKLRN